jgi:hypothetical protein
MALIVKPVRPNVAFDVVGGGVSDAIDLIVFVLGY